MLPSRPIVTATRTRNTADGVGVGNHVATSWRMGSSDEGTVSTREHQLRILRGGGGTRGGDQLGVQLRDGVVGAGVGDVALHAGTALAGHVHHGAVLGQWRELGAPARQTFYHVVYTVCTVPLCCLMSSVDILGTSGDQCRSTVQYSFTSTETRRLLRTDITGRPPRLTQLLDYEHSLYVDV